MRPEQVQLRSQAFERSRRRDDLQEGPVTVAGREARTGVAQNARLETTYVGDLAFFSPAPALV